MNYLTTEAEKTESFAPREFESLQLKEQPEADLMINDKHKRAAFIKKRAGEIEGIDKLKNLPDFYRRDKEIDEHTIQWLTSEYAKNILNDIQLEDQFKDDETMRWPEKFDNLTGMLDAAIDNNDFEAVQEVKNLINRPDMNKVPWPDQLKQKIEAFEGNQ